MSLLNDMLRDLSHQQKVADPAVVEQQPGLDLHAEEQRELFYNSSAAKPLPRTLLPSLVVFVLVLTILAVWKWGSVNESANHEPAIYAPVIASPNEDQAAITSAVAINESPASEPSVVQPVIVKSSMVEPALGERIAALESAITQLSTVVANVNHTSATETIALTTSEQKIHVPTANEQVVADELQTEQMPLEAMPENIPSVSIQEPFAPAAMKDEIVQGEPKLSISPNTKWQDQQQSQQANQLVAQGQVDIAIEKLQDFIATAQQPRESVKALLDIFALQERIEAMQALIAQADYLSVVEQQFYKAKLAVIQQQDMRAIELLEVHLGEAEQDENYRALLAGLYQRTGMHLEAANNYRRLLSVFGDKPAYWLGFALAQDALNQPQLAAQAYIRVNQYADLQPQVRTYVQQRIAALQQ